METEVSIRAFRAIDDIETCLKFVAGHQKVLENHGIYNVTSSSHQWMYSPSVFVIVVESLDIVEYGQSQSQRLGFKPSAFFNFSFKTVRAVTVFLISLAFFESCASR